MLERELEKRCRKYAKSHGGWLVKWVSPGTRGVPDDLLFLPGRVVLCEFKQRGKTATKLQAYYLRKINDFGIEAVVIDSAEDFHALF